MSRRLRIQFPGAIYHVINRGDRREPIFLNEADREHFLKTLGEACAKTGWQVHAFVLMPNHFHLMVETPEPNLMAGMKWFLGTYTTRFNRRHGLTGHLFSGRYKSLLVGGRGGYFRTVLDYVHLNPVRARLLAETQPIREFKWSSLPLFLAAPGQRPDWLRVDRALGECGIKADTTAGRAEFERRIEARRREELEEEFQGVRRDWCFGDEDFRRELLELSEKNVGQNHYGPELQESAEGKAERLVREELARAAWSEEDLRVRPKGDPVKIGAAARLRSETTMTLRWIASRLRMGTKGHLSHLLYWKGRGRRPQRVRQRPAKVPQRQVTLRPSVKARQANMPIPLTDPLAGRFDTSFD